MTQKGLGKAIEVRDATKLYKLYDKPVDRLKEALHPFKKKYHNEFYALRDISFDVAQGETLGVIGKNGSGKSTLLKLISGVLTPSSGHIGVNGRVSALLELGAGFNPEYTGIENIYLNGTIMGLTREQVDAKLNAIISFAEIGEFIYQPVKNYSSGMFARLAFAVAINVEPDILIVDEALSVGDMRFQKKCMERIDELKETGKTILFCSHDMHAVSELCDKAIWIKDGQVEAYGPSREVVSSFIAFMTLSDGVSRNEISVDKPHHYLRNSEEVEIRSVKLLDEKSGTEKNVFLNSENILVKFTYSVKTSLKDPNYSLLILRKDGQPAALSKTNYFKELASQNVIEGDKTVTFLIENQFNSGTYILGISIWDKACKISFASNRTTEFSVKSLNIAFGPMEEKAVFFPKVYWDYGNSAQEVVDTYSMKYGEELKSVLEQYNIGKEDICIVGSSVMSVRGLKQNNDIDILINPAVRSKLENATDSAFSLSNKIEVVGLGWADFLGVSDDDLIYDERFHEIIEGFKFVKLELLYIVKKYRNREKDIPDMQKIEEYAISSESWDKEFVYRYIDVCRTPLDSEKTVSLVELLSKQYHGQDFGRMDIFVRVLAIKDYFGEQNNGIALYNRMQQLRAEDWRRSNAFESFRPLIDSVGKLGFVGSSRITIDGNNNLFDGSHRVALALYHNCDFINYEAKKNCILKADYRINWFESQGFSEKDIKKIEDEKDYWFLKLGLYFHVILWPPVEKYFDEILADISAKYKVIEHSNYNLENEFVQFVRQIYAIDDIADWKVNKKIEGMVGNNKIIKVITLEIPEPRYRIKESTNNLISVAVEEIKKHYRERYSSLVEGYFHDILIHIGDNYDHNRLINGVLKQYSIKRG